MLLSIHMRKWVLVLSTVILMSIFTVNVGKAAGTQPSAEYYLARTPETVITEYGLSTYTVIASVTPRNGNIIDGILRITFPSGEIQIIQVILDNPGSPDVACSYSNNPDFVICNLNFVPRDQYVKVLVGMLLHIPETREVEKSEYFTSDPSTSLVKKDFLNTQTTVDQSDCDNVEVNGRINFCSKGKLTYTYGQYKNYFLWDSLPLYDPVVR